MAKISHARIMGKEETAKKEEKKRR